jgi:hypothetical protein
MLFRREFDPSTAVQLYSTFLPQVLDKVFETARQ